MGELMNIRLLQGDSLDVLQTLPDESVDCCVTSPPYWGLRDYGHEGQIGLEMTPNAYVSRIVDVFRQVRRVLRSDGTVWVNIGDSYAAERGGSHQPAETLAGGRGGKSPTGERVNRDRHDGYSPSRNAKMIGLKHKDLVGIPWRVAFALQNDGWYLRQDIIWHKPNPMPESVKDRCTKAHEYLFLLSKSEKYYWSNDAMAETAVDGNKKRNRRSVWSINVKPYRGAHFAVMPEALVEPCIFAGCRENGTVLDPFAGSGTVGVVSRRLGRNFVGIDLNPEYVRLADQRIYEDSPLIAMMENEP